jgi:hypothetical protein
MMLITVGKRQVTLPPRPCVVDDVLREVRRLNPPFVVKGVDGRESFRVLRRVFLAVGEQVRVECEDEGELRLACKLSVEDHNQWQTTDDTRRVVDDTEAVEREVTRRMAEDDEPDPCDAPTEEEDITIEEWGQLGYKWFKRDEVLYL